jgi:hypothetical protein
VNPRTFIVRQVPSNVALITVKITVSDCGISLGREKERADERTRAADLLITSRLLPHSSDP